VPVAPSDREERLRRFVERYPNVVVAPLAAVLDTKGLQRVLGDQVADPNQPALTDAERKDYAERSIKALTGLAQGTPPGYEVAPAEPAVYEVLRAGTLSPEGQQAALEVTSRLPGSRPQTELANVVLDTKSPAPVRLKAAEELVRNIQERSPLLTSAQVDALADLYNRESDAKLKAELALVLGGLRRDPRLSGERLLQYQLPTPGKETPAKGGK